MFVSTADKIAVIPCSRAPVQVPGVGVGISQSGRANAASRRTTMAPDAPTFRLHLMLFLRRNDMVFFLLSLVVFSAQPTPDTLALSPTRKNNRRIFVAPGFDGCCHAGMTAAERPRPCASASMHRQFCKIMAALAFETPGPRWRVGNIKCSAEGAWCYKRNGVTGFQAPTSQNLSATSVASEI